ncbi:MAG: transposase domain-containing protein [Streptosporangiales bacterium]|nr:transposase domain-containing protein [Streptosporangiales bacterium]
MTSDGPPDGNSPAWLPNPMSIGVLATAFPSDLVDAVIDEAGARERRYRTLPARFMVYYVLALAMFPPKGYVEVMCLLTGGLSWLRDEIPSGKTATVPAIAKARSRLGEAPLALLFDRVAGPLAPPETGGAFWRGFRLVSVDEIVFELPDTAENTAAFSRPSAPDSDKTPEARLVALGESRTGSLLGAAFGAASHPGTPLASGVAGHLNETTLLMADDRFPVGALWHDARARGAQLLWMASGVAPVPSEVLFDGTCLVRLPETWGRDGRDTVVRMIECRPCTPAGRPAGRTFTLLTTLTDPVQAPADEIVAAYEGRWRGVILARSLAAGQPSPRTALRSRSPDMARQEIWSMLCVYQSTRTLMWHASHALRLNDATTLAPRLVRVRRRRSEALSPAPAVLLACRR